MKFTPEAGLGDKAELIPNGTLVSAIVTVNQIKQSQQTDGRYLAIELTVSSGEFRNRKVWDMLCDPFDDRNSDAWRKMGMVSLTRALEAGGILNWKDKESYDSMNGKSIEEIARILDGLEVVIKVKIEKSSDPAHADKNKVGEWLTPNENSSGFAGYKKFKSSPTDDAGSNQQFPSPRFSNPSAGSAPAWLKKPSGNSNVPF